MDRDPGVARRSSARGARWAAGALLAGVGIAASGLLAAYVTARPTGPPRYKTPGRRKLSRDGRGLHRVRFLSADGLTLAGVYGEGSPGHAAIIVCHGWPGDLGDMLGLAGALRGAGFNVLAFDFRGCGESDRGPVTLGYREAQDVVGAVRFLRERRPGQAQRIGVVGLSMGAAAAILAAAGAPEIEAVVADSSYARLDREVDRVFGQFWGPLAPLASSPARWLAERLIGIPLSRVSPLEGVAQLSPRPLLIIHGTRDHVTNVEDARALYRASGEPKALWLVEGAGHSRTRRAAPAEYDRRVVGFFRQRLAGAP